MSLPARDQLDTPQQWDPFKGWLQQFWDHAASMPYANKARGAWTAGTAYAAGDFVERSGALYIAQFGHVSSGSFAADQTAGRWSFLDSALAAAVSINAKVAAVDGQIQATLAGLEAAAAITETGQNRAAVAADRSVVESLAGAVVDSVQYSYLVDNGAALAALSGMTANQRAYVRDTQHVWSYSGSAWVDTGLAPTSTKLDKSVFDKGVNVATSRGAAFIAIVYAEGGKVAVWLEDGKLAAAGLGDSLLTQVRTALNDTVTVAGLRSLTSRSSSLVPIAYADGGKVAIWLDAGRLAAAGLAPSLIAAITADLLPQLSGVYAKLSSVPAYNRPLLATDGRGLFLRRAKRAALRRTGAGVIRELVTGDSWAEHKTISQQLLNIQVAKHGQSGEGWQSVTGDYPLAGVTASKSGWTLYDVNVAGTVPPYGSGPDGFAITATGTAATWSLALKTQALRIFYQNADGTFRYRVDGGAWTAVAQTATNAKASVLISGLSDAVHTFEIDLTGNAGRVTLHGFYATRTAAGYELSKCGNGGLSGSDVTNFASQIAFFAPFLDPLNVIIVLNTNDFRLNKTVASFVAGVLALAGAWRAALPDVGITLVMPAACGATGTYPQSDYRDAMLALAQTNGYEYYSAFDEFSTYAKENALGQWVDTLHLSDDGAQRLAFSLDNRILGV